MNWEARALLLCNERRVLHEKIMEVGSIVAEKVMCPRIKVVDQEVAP